MGTFCVKCGKPNPQFNRLCKECFLKEYDLIKIPEKIEVEVCAHCNAQLIKGKWIRRGIPEDEIIYKILEDNISWDEKIEDIIIDLEIIQRRGMITSCLIRAKAKLLGEEITQDFYTEVWTRKTSCPYCSKYKSGYYESVIQLRADERTLTVDEIRLAEEVINKTLKRSWHTDKLSYLAKKTRQKEGIDYYIGSYKAAKQIIAALREKLGGLVKESPRLMGKNKSTGKDVYRVWISFKLPKFRKGDLISYKDKIGIVKSMNSRGVLIYDIEKLEPFSILWREYQNMEKIATPEDVKKTIITAISPSKIQILDPKTYEPLDLELKPWMDNLKIGDEIPVIQIEDKIYIIKGDNSGS